MKWAQFEINKKKQSNVNNYFTIKKRVFKENTSINSKYVPNKLNLYQ